MKKAFFPILVLVLGVICGCEKTIDFGDEDPDGYWYMSSIQMKAEDATGIRIHGFCQRLVKIVGVMIKNIARMIAVFTLGITCT